MSADSDIAADALIIGDGGQIITWADGDTVFYGSARARGGSVGGNGGLVEISGWENLLFAGTVDLTATNGELGLLLLDPTNILISNDASNPPAVEDEVPTIFQTDFADNNITVNATTLQNQAADIRLEATNDIEVAAGTNLDFVDGSSITFAADADADDAGIFRLSAGGTINTNGRSLTIIASDVELESGSLIDVASGDVTINDSTIETQGGDLTLLGQGSSDDFNDGIFISNSTLDAGSGDIELVGIGLLESSPNNINGAGVWIQNSTVITNDSGNITITGTGADDNFDSSVDIPGVDDAIEDPFNNHGVTVREGSVIQTVDGNLSLIGFPGDVSASNNHGINITDSGTLVEVIGSGQLSLEGTGGTGQNVNYGVSIVSEATVRSGSGGLLAQGIGGSTNNDGDGIRIFGGVTVETINGGDLNLIGTGSNSDGSDNGNAGVSIFNQGAPSPLRGRRP